MSNLKLCPFCGGEASNDEVSYNSIKQNDWLCGCGECLIFFRGQTAEAAAKAWNTRTADAERQWVPVEKQMPAIGQTVFLFSNGVVQEETFTLDIDDNEYGVAYFWARDDLEDCPIVKSSDQWMPLPPAPEDE